MSRKRFAECSAEGSQNVPKNIILGREDWVIFTWKLHHLFTIPWCHSILTEILLIDSFDFVLTRDLNKNYSISLVIQFIIQILTLNKYLNEN
jgi:hypothetical protein